MGLLYGRAGRLTAENGGFRPGQWGCAARLLLARGVELDAVDPRNGTTAGAPPRAGAPPVSTMRLEFSSLPLPCRRGREPSVIPPLPVLVAMESPYERSASRCRMTARPRKYRPSTSPATSITVPAVPGQLSALSVFLS